LNNFKNGGDFVTFRKNGGGILGERDKRREGMELGA